ncbi:methyltransferase domain-containing protein [Cytobacillus firmus]|uniref:methyltransferase domain-containing protein n=1 Tax=Cytobacillus firmus TaxID=1399 RepID=UPI0022283A7A|nr:methyltransferase domain-containing protein [Cytobacillus firmus]
MIYGDTQLMSRIPDNNQLNKDQNHIAYKETLDFTHSLVCNLRDKDILAINFSENFSTLLLSSGVKSCQAGSFENLELKDSDILIGQFWDVIIINNVIDIIPKLEDAFENIKKLLRPQGYIILNTPIASNTKETFYSALSFNTTFMDFNKKTAGTLLSLFFKQDFICAKEKKGFFGFVRRSDIKHYAPPKKKVYIDKYLSSLSSPNNHQEPVKETGKLMIGCVTENNSKYQRQTLNLVQSIRWFGGDISRADIYVCIVEKADDDFLKELKKFGVFVRIVKRFNQNHPQSNKLRFFELPEIDFYDTIMFLDCDTIIVQDPLRYIDGKSFQAEIAAGATVPHEVFKDLFNYYDLKIPDRSYTTTLSRASTIWYCNAGVLIFPKEILKSFFPVWRNYTEDLIKNKHLLNNYFQFCEQASLTLSFVKNPVPFKKLPMKMNFPLVGRTSMAIQQCDPVIIHYHHRSDESGLIHNVTKSPYAKLRIQEFNNLLKNYSH